MFTVAIIGKPNVGKSTLFNKIVGYRKAITHNFAGVTRDYKESKVLIGDLLINLIDTAGFYTKGNLTDLEKKINAQTRIALSKADIVLFVVDGQSSISANDRDIAIFLRRYDLPTMTVVNKCDSKKVADNISDIFEIGSQDLCQISAEHNIGFGSIYDFILKNRKNVVSDGNVSDCDIENVIKLSVVGRPNAGKSTCINGLLKEDRLITGKEPGITRDSIISHLSYKNNNIHIVDTAGVRKKSNIDKASVEQLSVGQTIHSIDSVDIVVLLVDVNMLLETQDLKIANIAINKGKPLIFAVNKIDVFKKDDKLNDIKKRLDYFIKRKLSAVKNIPIVYISAIKGYNLTKILDEAISQFSLWHTKITTSKLNKWIEYIVEEHQPPLSSSGNRIKIKYMTQIKAKPPTFRLFINKPEDLPDHYMRYLENQFAEHFNLQSIPIKFIKSKTNNPYVK